ncbi:MAG: hypothetical protein DCC55_02800 [Chloroflexi bacterium]|nr:MAG: hypothetical protein DCC55_02800 [Chloroflexota bacterium]
MCIEANHSETSVAQRSKNAQPTSPNYRAYLVRLWRDEAQEPWRASAQSVQSGELIRFATLEELFAFLEIHMPDSSQMSHADGCSALD